MSHLEYLMHLKHIVQSWQIDGRCWKGSPAPVVPLLFPSLLKENPLISSETIPSI